jgi:hypothetical protein
MSEPSIIEIRPHPRGWQCYESKGVAPFFTGPNAKQFAINYAKPRMSGRSGEIRVVNAAGEVEQTLTFTH